MRIISNEKLIQRNGKIGQYTTVAALVAAGLGIYILVKFPDNLSGSLIPVILALFLFQIGSYFTTRWSGHPRPDEVVDKSLKGLGREYCLYHYITPASHLLVGPAGIWILLPFNQAGTVLYDGKRWRNKGGGFAHTYLRIFGVEGLGRPDLDIKTEAESLRSFLLRHLPEGSKIPEIQAALVFTHPKVELKMEGAPNPALFPKDLKDFIRNKARTSPLSEELINTIQSVLPKPTRED